MCPEQVDAMKYLAMSIGVGITFALAVTAAAQPLAKDIAARIEATPIQTLTISDEQFLKGDAYRKPTTIAGVLRVAQGPGRLPLSFLSPAQGALPPMRMCGTGNSKRWVYLRLRWIHSQGEASSAPSSINRNLVG